MEAAYESFAQYDCRRHGREDYGLILNLVNLVRRKHRHYDVRPKQKGDDRIIQLDDFLRAKREQNSVIRQIKDALKSADVTLARHLAMEGAQRYKRHHGLQEYARLLAPPRIIDSHVPPTSSIRANHAWLKAHRQEYQGHWIALRSGELVGVADDLDILVNNIGQTKGILLTKA